MTFPITSDESAFLLKRQLERDKALNDARLAQQCAALSENAMGEFLLLLARSRGAERSTRFTQFSIEQVGADQMLMLTEAPMQEPEA